MTPGRNDPCTCGSGRKFKRCCGAAASFRAGQPAGASADSVHVAVAANIPTIVNNDGHLTVYTTSLYEVFDPESLAHEIGSWRPKPDLDEKRDRAGRLQAFEAHYQRKPQGPGPADRVLVARLEWKGGPLVVETNSTERDLEIRDRLMELAPRGLRLVRTLGRSVPDLLSDPPSRDRPGSDREADELARNPEVQARLAEMMRAYSREWCDTVIPALGKRRPRTLVRTEQGRAKVLALIAEMESRPRPMGMGGMDFELIRRELGLPGL